MIGVKKLTKSIRFLAENQNYGAASVRVASGQIAAKFEHVKFKFLNVKANTDLLFHYFYVFLFCFR